MTTSDDSPVKTMPITLPDLDFTEKEQDILRSLSLFGDVSRLSAIRASYADDDTLEVYLVQRLISQATIHKDTQDRLLDLANIYNDFRNQVRAKAIEVAREKDWCQRGLNDALEELGLDKVEPKFQVRITLVVSTEEDVLRESTVRELIIGTHENLCVQINDITISRTETWVD